MRNLPDKTPKKDVKAKKPASPKSVKLPRPSKTMPVPRGIGQWSHRMHILPARPA